MNKILTISIAAYNVENYIGETLNSLIAPEVIDDLEIFVVNDGSKDNTVEIVKPFVEKFPNSIYLIDKENGGYGSTVNYSIKHAKGKYFKLLDGDDWFDKSNLIDLIASMKISDADAFVSNVIEAHDNGPSIEKYPFMKEIDNKKINIKNADKFPVVAMWAYAFKTEKIKEGYKKLPSHTLFTDQIFVINALKCVETIQYKSKPIYFWRIGRDEQSNNIKSIRKNYSNIIRVANIINETVEKYDKNQENYDYLLKRAAAYYSNSISMLLRLDKNKKNLEIIKKWENETNKNYPFVYRAARKSKKIKLLRISNYLLFKYI